LRAARAGELGLWIIRVENIERFWMGGWYVRFAVVSGG